MSLHTLANHLQSAGRGEDKVLVHMTPGEVQGLQSLAMAQGGSLTINPQTGLPEAGILSALLPMVAGFFLGPAGIGLTAMQSAVAVGALGTAATGSLGKGFMMGLGAYGGAGLGAGLSSAGAANLPATASGQTAANLGQQTFNAVGAPVELTAPIGSTTAGSAADAVTKTAVESGGLGGIQAYSPSQFANATGSNVAHMYAPQTSVLPGSAETLKAGLVNPPSVDVTSMGPNLNLSGTSAGMRNIGYDMYGGFTQAPPPLSTSLPSSTVPSLEAAKAGLNTADAGIKYGTDIAQTMRNTPTPVNDIDAIMSQGTPPSAMDKLGAGFDRATSSWEGAKEVWNATPKGTGYGLAATGMSVLQAQQEEAAKDAAAANAASRSGYIRPYEFSTEQDPNAYANTSTSESRYFVEPRYTALEAYKVKDGGVIGYAVGGPVEQMSAENAIGGNMMYPQSQLKTDMYSNPMVQRPMPTNVIRSGIDAPVGAYTGEQRFALGGSATAKATAPTTDTKYAYNPETMQYTQSPTTAQTNPLSGMFGMTGYNGGFGGMIPALLRQMKQPTQPTTISETSGGVAAPYIPPSGLAAANTSMIPNIQMQPQQNVNQQLGLEAFYPMMEQQLALKGSNLQAQGYANGGVPRFGGGGTMAQPTAEGTARQKYASEHAPGIIKTVSDDEWNKYKKSQNLSFESAASKAPTYTYNPQNLQFTDSAGKVTMGMQPQFIPMPMMTPEEQIGMSGYQGYAEGGTANGGYSLGSYSDGGRLLRGPGDGVSDSIPASIGDRQPARLADGEFILPARIVSEIGNGSTEAGARKLYAMMDRVQKARKKTVGKSKVAVNTRADKLLPA